MLEQPDAYSLVNFASRHGISRSKVYGEIRAGRLTARKIGDRTIILAEDGKAWRESLPKVPANCSASARDETQPTDSQDDAEAWLRQLPVLPVTKTTT
jgi:hypothetical protein